jgi:hypothetical protein
MEEDEAYRDIWHMGDDRNPQRFWWESPNETDCLEDLFLVRSIILICILNEQEGRVCSGII